MRIFTAIFCIILLLSCNSGNGPKPDNLISKSKMAEILSEIHRVESRVSNFNVSNTDTLNFLFRKLETEVFKRHKVDTTDYYQSYKYYLVNPEEFSEIYKNVLKILKDQNKIDSLADAALRKTIKVDSSRKTADSVYKKLDKLRIKKRNLFKTATKIPKNRP